MRSGKSPALLREQPYARDHRLAVERRMELAAARPATIPELLRWYRAEFRAELPPRLHERGVEPESAIGSPRLAGAFRAYLTGSLFATDHDDRIDMDRRGAARRRPIARALAVLAHRRPLSARYLFALAWCGVEWSDLALAWNMLPEIGEEFTLGTLERLWDIWARDQLETASEIVV